jgi:hypothetical protein
MGSLRIHVPGSDQQVGLLTAVDVAILRASQILKFSKLDESCTSNPKSEVADWTLAGAAVLAAKFVRSDHS